VIAMNEPSAERFAPELIPGGLLLLNSSMVKKPPLRSDLTVIWVPATQAASDLGNPRVANMVMLGAYLRESQVLNPESVLASFKEHGMREDLLKLNRLALHTGRDSA
jgi:2-oxoglutarate ferredoxin oxidoreductase subunit gamma